LIRAIIVAGIAVAGYVAYLNYLVTAEFQSKRWSLPARVYARPLELYAGLRLSPANLVGELQAADYRRSSADRPGTYSPHGEVYDLTTRTFRYWDGEAPSRHIAVSFDGDTVGSVRDASSDKPIDLIRVDPALIGSIYPAKKEDRILLKLSEVPPALRKGLVAVEDRHFHQHLGISPTSIARALWADLRAGRVVQGGSTITQQLVKNFYLSNRRTLWRKANEAVMAVLLALHYSKSEILQTYINEVYLAQDGPRSIHGFGLASEYYFGRPLSSLRLDQLALLIGLVKGPSYYNPRRYPERARERRNLVLKTMAREGVVGLKAAKAAEREPLDVASRPRRSEASYPAFMDLVKEHLRRDYPLQELTTGGLRVFTTLAPSVQMDADRAVEQRLKALRDPKLEAAAVVVNTNDGEVLAVVGGRDTDFAGFNRALDARRQIGSLVKPAIYLTALEDPAKWGLGSVLQDAPITIENSKGKKWQPRNYDRKFHGKVALWSALAHSYNVPTVRLGLALGLPAVTKTFQRMGGDLPARIYPSFLLGASLHTPLEMAEVYETLASGGFRTPLRSVRAVMTRNGDVLKHYPLNVKKVFPADAVYLTEYAMQQVVQQGTGRDLARWVSPSLGVAGKTGTTDDTRDSWFAGFTGDRLGVVWVGRDDNGKTGLTGATGALTIWGALFSQLDPQPLQLAVPDDIDFRWIQAGTGLLASRDCEGAVKLPYRQGYAPKQEAKCEGGGPIGWLKRIFR